MNKEIGSISRELTEGFAIGIMLPLNMGQMMRERYGNKGLIVPVLYNSLLFGTTFFLTGDAQKAFNLGLLASGLAGVMNKAQSIH